MQLEFFKVCINGHPHEQSVLVGPMRWPALLPAAWRLYHCLDVPGSCQKHGLRPSLSRTCGLQILEILYQMSRHNQRGSRNLQSVVSPQQACHPAQSFPRSQSDHKQIWSHICFKLDQFIDLIGSCRCIHVLTALHCKRWSRPLV